MRGKTITHKGAMSIRHRQTLLVGNDPIPEGSDVANLVLWRQVVEAGRRERESVGHGRRIAPRKSAAKR
jgi:hypothetical protein